MKKVVVQMGVAQNQIIIVVATGFAQQLRVIVHRFLLVWLQVYSLSLLRFLKLINECILYKII
jgi:hypothetical protein